MIQLLVYRGFYCGVKVMKNPFTLFFFFLFFFLPFLLAGSAVALRVSRQFMTRVLPEMDEMLCIYCCELVLVSQTKSFQQ